MLSTNKSLMSPFPQLSLTASAFLAIANVKAAKMAMGFVHRSSVGNTRVLLINNGAELTHTTRTPNDPDYHDG